eukprot:3934471-Pyramimonas_sp.AAC.2
MQDQEAVGRLTGYLGGVSHFGALISSVPWGMVSDHVGRKPVIIFGQLFAGMTTLFFGKIATASLLLSTWSSTLPIKH